MNLPNQLTVLRILLTFGFIGTVIREGLIFKAAAAVIFGAASVTDYLDGYIAKTRNLVSDFGKIMDPIADKFLLLAAFFIFARMDIVEMWMVILIAVREIFITGWRLAVVQKGKVLAARIWGKVKTVLQITAVSLILLYLILIDLTMIHHWPETWVLGMSQGIRYLMWVVIAVTLFSGIHILWCERGCFHGKQDR